jgi:hypothetical protein
VIDNLPLELSNATVDPLTVTATPEGMAIGARPIRDICQNV